MIAMCKCTVRTILNTKSTCVSVMNTHACFVIAQVIASLCIASGAMKEWTLVSIWAYAGGLVVFGAIIIGAIVEGAVPLSHRSAPPLVHKVPVEARERSVLCAFALYKEGTLFDAKFLQVSGMRIHRATHYFVAYFDARVDAALLAALPSFSVLFSFSFLLFIYLRIRVTYITFFLCNLVFIHSTIYPRSTHFILGL